MLTDLRDKLEAVGRLDALDSTGERLLDYYDAQNPDRLDARSLSRRAKAQLLVGDIAQRRNELGTALSAYEAAAATTTELLSREPNNPDRVFDHAQSVFYVGYIAHQRGDLETAGAQLSEYLDLARKLVAFDATNEKWRMELAFATSNLGALEFARENWAQAESHFDQSAAAWRVMRNAAPSDDTVAMEYAYALSWLAFAEMKQGEFADANAVIREQLEVYAPILKRRPDDTQVIDPMHVAKRRLAETALALGDTAAAATIAAEAKDISSLLTSRDRDNAFWKRDAAQVEILRSQIAAISKEDISAIDSADNAVALSASVIKSDASDRSAQKVYARALARRVLAGGDPLTRNHAAARLLEKFDAAREAERPDLEIIGNGGLALGRYYADIGEELRSAVFLRTASETLGKNKDRLSADDRFTLYQLCKALKENDACRSIADELRASGFRHPAFAALQER